MNCFTKENDTLVCRLETETLRLTPWGKDSLRVTARPMGEPELPDWALLPQPKQNSEVFIDGDTASITNGRLKAVAEHKGWPNRIQLSFYNEKGDLLLAEKEFQGAVNRRAREYSPIPGGDYGLTVTFEAQEGEKLYGMGQYQQEVLEVSGCSFELAHRNSQASVPFLLSSRGYGFLWHNPAIGRAVLAKNGVEWSSRSTRQLDYWITAGDTPAQIVGNYTAAVGRPPMMPEYGLGYWQCKLRYWNQEQLLETAREYKRRSIPVDVIVCDFFHWPHMGDFRFDPEFFPDPKAMTDELRKLGITLMVSVWPQIGLDSENFEEMRDRGLLVQSDRGVNVSMQFGGDSMFYDATNPAARDYVWGKCKNNYYNQGVRAFWLDEAEPEYATYDYDNYRYHMGTALQVGNIYPQMYSRGFFEGMQKEGMENPVNLVRCAWAGSARYGALVWSGDIHSDFATFRRQICAGLSMGLCGIPWWTTDIGGFSGGDPEDPSFRELLVRWFQWGAFCPVMRMHGDRQPATPLFRKDGRSNVHTGGDNEVWSFGGDAYNILCKYINLREIMRPYTRRLMEEAHTTGAPVMRPMFYEFPEDEACWELKDQYMFGPEVLAAPVTEAGAVRRKVYLPAGEWTDLHSGRKSTGGQWVVAEAPLECMPVFLKGGAHPDWVGKI